MKLKNNFGTFQKTFDITIEKTPEGTNVSTETSNEWKDIVENGEAIIIN